MKVSDLFVAKHLHICACILQGLIDPEEMPLIQGVDWEESSSQERQKGSPWTEPQESLL